MIRVCLAGATGWVGKPLTAAIEASDDLDLVAAVARRSAGSPLGRITISDSVEEALRTPSDVFVDYTSAEAAKTNVLAAIAAGRNVVIGTSGLVDSDFAEIDAAARDRHVGVIAVGNFAISAALLQRFAVEAAKYFPSWEIIDYAHDSKVDAPSGTARQLAWSLGQVGNPRPAVPIDQTIGPRDSRGTALNGTQVHSVRLPGHTIGIDALFGAEDEQLTISYRGGAGAGPYLKGTLMAIRRVAGVKGVMRGLDQLL